MSTSALVTPTTLPGRGRSLVATTTILPGQVILSDCPLLLYPTSFPSPFCPNCLRSLNTPTTQCPKCPSLFCSPLCLSHHHPSLCHSLSLLLLPQTLDPDLLHQSLFLIHAHSLSLSSPTSFSLLLSLFPGGGPHSHQEPLLHPDLPRLFPPDLTASLLAVDRFNAFGIMEPPAAGLAEEERKVRAYGIYAAASLFNHDCLPNACRFDYVDTRGTEIYVRAIHEIPAGREVCLSYFPVRWGYGERQRRLWEEYGFRCECDRCRVEMNWKEEEEREGDEDMMEEEEEEDFPHEYFFMRYVCDREECGGTMAPLPPSSAGVVSDVMECNVCGQLKREEDVGAVGDDGDMVGDDDE